MTRNQVVAACRRVGSLLQRLTDWSLIVLVGGQFCVLLLQVFTRYVLNDPISWGEEVALHLFIWMIMLGSAYGIRRASHPRINLLSALEQRTRALTMLQYVTSVFFLLGLGVSGAVLAYVNRDQVSPNADISQFFLYAAVPVGTILMLVEMAMLRSGGSAPAGLP